MSDSLPGHPGCTGPPGGPKRSALPDKRRVVGDSVKLLIVEQRDRYWSSGWSGTGPTVSEAVAAHDLQPARALPTSRRSGRPGSTRPADWLAPVVGESRTAEVPIFLVAVAA